LFLTLLTNLAEPMQPLALCGFAVHFIIIIGKDYKAQGMLTATLTAHAPVDLQSYIQGITVSASI